MSIVDLGSELYHTSFSVGVKMKTVTPILLLAIVIVYLAGQCYSEGGGEGASSTPTAATDGNGGLNGVGDQLSFTLTK